MGSRTSDVEEAVLRVLQFLQGIEAFFFFPFGEIRSNEELSNYVKKEQGYESAKTALEKETGLKCG